MLRRLAIKVHFRNAQNLCTRVSATANDINERRVRT